MATKMRDATDVDLQAPLEIYNRLVAETPLTRAPEHETFRRMQVFTGKIPHSLLFKFP
ncbi:MAG: hypothetical protein JW943_14530 [Deltaproteobacteria bacterium]|nr:hypothetical protein [Deltaproteobacteria bacterium]